jgi:hypothetical protein
VKAFRAWLVVALIVLLPAGMIVAGVGMASRLDREVVPSEQRSIALPVENVALDGAQPISLALSWADSRTLVAPSWSGTVTAVKVKPGDRLQTGTRLVQIDGVWRVALRTPSPLYAPVGPRSDDAQQKSALAVLRALGYVVHEDWWDWRATQAVQSLAKDLGVNGWADATVVDPGWFVWIPTGSLKASSIDLAVGAPAPAPGTPIVTLTPRLLSASLDSDSEHGAATSSASTRGSWTVKIRGTDIKVARFPIDDADALARLGEGLGVAHPDVATGTVSRSGAPRGWIVPTSSVYVDAAGRTCLVLTSKRKQVAKTMTVEVLPGGEPGVASVTADVDGALLIQSNPSRLAQPIRCS